VLAAPRQEKQQIGGRVGGQGGAQAGGAGAGPVAGQVGRGPGRSIPDAARQDAGQTPQKQPQSQQSQIQQSQPFQARGNRAGADRVLRNQFFASKSPSAGDPAARVLARSTFHGRFFDPGWRRHFPRPIVIGWVGPLFWPYAYNDFVDYTFYPHAYDTFWPNAYDDVYEGMFGRYAYGTGSAYAAVGRAGSERGGARKAATADLCAGQTASLTGWPIEQIAQAVEPNDAQRTALDEFKDAATKALDLLRASCPTELPSTPTGRLAAMHQRLDAMLAAVRMVRPALEKFYSLLNDEQKARFNALGPEDVADQQSRRDLTQVCGERASGIASLPIEQIGRTVRPDEAQRAALKELEDATSQAVELLKSDCPTYRALTPVVRLEAMEQRLDAMLRAVQTVEPALQKFYGSLGDEQKERFNRLPPRQA
jgi:ABC-type transporter MlaC component